MAIPWQQSGRDAANDRIEALTALLQPQKMKTACGRYINSLNLQDRINAGEISETRALQIVHIEMQKFQRNLHTFVNNEIMELQKNNSTVDQTDLNLQLNMQVVLQNPNSFASMMMADTYSANAQAAADDQAQNQAATNQMDSDQQTQQQQTASTNEPSDPQLSMGTADDLAVGAAFTDGITALAKGDEKGVEKAAENVVEKATGHKVDFESLKEDLGIKSNEQESKTASMVPRPSAVAKEIKDKE